MAENRRKNRNPDITCCQLCDRKVRLTFHHLIPRKLHRRNHFRKHFSKPELHAGVMICSLCHRGIHKLFDEMTLGKNFSSLDALQSNEEIQNHLAWVRKQKESN